MPVTCSMVPSWIPDYILKHLLTPQGLDRGQGEFRRLVSITSICIVLAFPERIPRARSHPSSLWVHSTVPRGWPRVEYCARCCVLGETGRMREGSCLAQSCPFRRTAQSQVSPTGEAHCPLSAQCCHCKPHPEEPRPRAA